MFVLGTDQFVVNNSEILQGVKVFPQVFLPDAWYWQPKIESSSGNCFLSRKTLKYMICQNKSHQKNDFLWVGEKNQEIRKSIFLLPGKYRFLKAPRVKKSRYTWLKNLSNILVILVSEVKYHIYFEKFEQPSPTPRIAQIKKYIWYFTSLTLITGT